MRYDERDLERLLRAALRDEAERQQPAGDGLSRIRARTTGRRRHWRTWLTPVLALAGAAAVIATAVAAPSLLTDSGRSPRLTQPGGQPIPAPATTGRPSAGPTPYAPYGALGTPYGGSQKLQDMVTVWPYPSRRTGYEQADRDVADGTWPALKDARQTAVDFVASFVGGDAQLVAQPLGAHPPGLLVRVSRKVDGGGEVPVSTVYLVRVRIDDRSPYVVVGASRARIDPVDTLTISKLPKVVGTAPFTARGLARPLDGMTDRVVIVQLREPGSTEVLAQQSAPVSLAGARERYWYAELTPLHRLPGTGVVAAWTLDDQGQVVEFVAAPTGLG